MFFGIMPHTCSSVAFIVNNNIEEHRTTLLIRL